MADGRDPLGVGTLVLGEVADLVGVVRLAVIADAAAVEGHEQRSSRPVALVRCAAVRRARGEGEHLARLELNRLPREVVHEGRVDAAVTIGWKELVVLPGHQLEAAVVDRCVVDRQHHRDVIVGELVGGGVLVRSEPGTAGQLEVDLLLVEHGRFGEERTDQLDEGPGGGELPEAVVVGHEILSPGDRHAAIGLLVMDEDGAVGVHVQRAVRDVVHQRAEFLEHIVSERVGHSDESVLLPSVEHLRGGLHAWIIEYLSCHDNYFHRASLGFRIRFTDQPYDRFCMTALRGQLRIDRRYKKIVWV